MYLNTLKPAKGAKKAPRRLGRGVGSTLGKTCGRGHKGQHARSGGYHKVGFEGGQMPLQRRLPKFGFHSRLKQFSQEINLGDLDRLVETTVSLSVLRAAKLVNDRTKKVKVIASGKLSKSVTIAADVHVTKGARAAIESAGGSVQEVQQ